jgi:hypothetical protein
MRMMQSYPGGSLFMSGQLVIIIPAKWDEQESSKEQDKIISCNMYYGHINNLILVAQMFAYEENVATDHSCCCGFYGKGSITYMVATFS